MEEGEEIEELRPMLMEATKAELVRYIKCVAGKHTPEIFKIAREFGNIVERTPQYHPELQPIELIWSRLKADYSRRYEKCRVAELLGSFFRDLPEAELVATVDHADKIAARLTGQQEALIIDDDMASLLIGESPT